MQWPPSTALNLEYPFVQLMRIVPVGIPVITRHVWGVRSKPHRGL